MQRVLGRGDCHQRAGQPQHKLNCYRRHTSLSLSLVSGVIDTVMPL